MGLLHCFVLLFPLTFIITIANQLPWDSWLHCFVVFIFLSLLLLCFHTNTIIVSSVMSSLRLADPSAAPYLGSFIFLPSYMRSYLQQSDLKRQRQSQFLQLPDGNLKMIYIVLQQSPLIIWVGQVIVPHRSP